MTRIQVGGLPEERPGFWKKYQDNLEHNRATGYCNKRVQIIEGYLRAMQLTPGARYYYRHGRLVREKEVHDAGR